LLNFRSLSLSLSIVRQRKFLFLVVSPVRHHRRGDGAKKRFKYFCTAASCQYHHHHGCLTTATQQQQLAAALLHQQAVCFSLSAAFFSNLLTLFVHNRLRERTRHFWRVVLRQL
jgi:hypothetical protein